MLNQPIDYKALFFKLFNSSTEEELEKVLQENSVIFKNENWSPLGGDKDLFGVIENQQSSPIAALIEKITNSIDAILMKKCYENGCSPKSKESPESMESAIELFFPDSKNWDIASNRNTQAENIQILADGPRMNTSITIYDDGEGQHPEDFEATLLSLLKGNKNDIPFVQGKYNMGGAGAIVFCGKKRYQLIASRRFDGTGKIGFTIVREHPITDKELKEINKKNTWYEYLKIDGFIPSFPIDSIDLNLHNRSFSTGTIIKLYSYALPAGSRSVISRDLNQSINEYLFEPALPILTVDRKERYPDDINLERDLFGLKRRLEKEDNKYIEEFFSEKYTDLDLFGEEMAVTCYVFKPRMDNKSVKETTQTIQREFFKNNQSVLFSLNGQVHGSYTSEFITRSLKMNLLKNHLLIHVDCTKMKYEFRKELFMASRDRLKNGEETTQLRAYLARQLSRSDSRLSQIVKRRKELISVEGSDTTDLLKNISRSLPLNNDLLKLINNTFKLEVGAEKPRKSKKEGVNRSKVESEIPFNPQRFPSIFKLKNKKNGQTPVVSVPMGGEKRIQFETDVEDHYFDRVEEPGNLKLALLNFKGNDSEGGTAPGPIDKIEEVFNINTSSPQKGTIKVHINPTKDVNVGDEAQIKVTLVNSGGEDFEQVLWVKISDQEKKKEEAKKEKEEELDKLGIPPYYLAYKEKRENMLSWEEVESQTIQSIDYNTIIIPYIEGENLEAVYINMDSTVYLNFLSKYKNPSEEQLTFAERKYITSVYFHTLFLYAITRRKKYSITQSIDEEKERTVDIGDYLKDVFESYYSEFILNFDAKDIMEGIGE